MDETTTPIALAPRYDLPHESDLPQYAEGPHAAAPTAAIPPAFRSPRSVLRRVVTEPRRGLATVAGVALVAGLLGGGIAGATLSHSDSGSPTMSDSSIGSSAPSIIPAAATATQSTAQAVAAKVTPSVVSIDVRNTHGSSGLLGRSDDSGIVGSGSGVVISKDGLILTNNHVGGQGDLTVTFSDGRTVPAKLIKADPVTDLAVIKAQGITGATPIGFGRSSDLVVGQTVYAMGSPLGLSGTFTSGIVSALHRPVVPQDESGSGASSVIDAIQTDAPINPGNSGGALVDANGNLVGITSAIASLGGSQSGSIGLGFAIPVDQAKVIAEQLAKGVAVEHGQLGVQVTDSDSATQRGAVLERLTTNGSAARAGLRAGDVVTGFDGRAIEAADALVAGVRSSQPNTTHRITYVRDGATKSVTVTLGSDATGQDS